ASSSMIGDTCLQGPHQSAQKSTTTGLSDFRTTSSKVASVTSATAPMKSPLLQLSVPAPTDTKGIEPTIAGALATRLDPGSTGPLPAATRRQNAVSAHPPMR